MPITSSLGSLAYTLANVSIDYEYWYLQSTNNIPFYDVDFDNNDFMYVLSEYTTNNSLVLYKFKEYDEYPYTIINGVGYTHASTMGDGSIVTSSQLVPRRLKYNSFLNRIVVVGYERNKYPFVFPYDTVYPATASAYDTDIELPSPPSPKVYARYPLSPTGASSGVQYTDLDCNDSNGVMYLTGYSDITSGASNMVAFVKKYSNGLTSTTPNISDPYSTWAPTYIGVITNNTWTAGVKILTSSIVLGHTYSVNVSSREVIITNINPASISFGGNYYMAQNWQRKLTSTLFLQMVKLDKDSSDNIYVTLNDTNSNYGYVVKYNSSGTIQWQRQINNVQLKDIYVYNDDIYIVGVNTSNNLFIAKYDDTGIIQWQNKVAGTTFVAESIKVHNNNIYACGNALSSGFILKLPTDGSIPGDGSYDIVGATIVYSTASQIETSGSLTDAVGSTAPSGSLGENLIDMNPNSSYNQGIFTATNLE